MSSSKAQQDEWSGKIGVILAVAGSAVGLGNFLRFPGLAAQYGGGAFMVAYGLMLVRVPCWRTTGCSGSSAGSSF